MAEAIMMNKKSDWRLITHKVFTEDAQRWKTNVDDNGNQFSLSAFKAYIRSCDNTSEYTGWVWLTPYYTDWANFGLVRFGVDSSKTADNEWAIECGAEIACGYIFPTLGLRSLNATTDRNLRNNTSVVIQDYNNGQPAECDSITGFSITGYNTGAIPAGMEIWIWGKE